MTLTDMLLAEFDNEMKVTRAVLERTPVADAAWKPHPKSTSLGDLAVHIATIPSWLVPTVTEPELDLGGAGGPAALESVEQLLARFDENVRNARAALAGARDASLAEPWTLRSGSHTVFTAPRGAVIRSFVMSHLIHHRGQFTVYLRLRNVPLPSVYGPTADV
ncbi:MAG TPA: DinB family protein [Gemmatimonadales bacterium]